MAKKKSALDITRFSGLDWQKNNSEEGREVIDGCDFCKCDIYNTDNYWEAFGNMDRNMDACYVACKDCGNKAGLEW